MVNIISKSWQDGVWFLQVEVLLPNGNRMGSHYIEGDETLTDEDLSKEILKLYK